ncbi:Hypothetical predicted protein, partial [Paramuricea clavata]
AEHDMSVRVSEMPIETYVQMSNLPSRPMTMQRKSILCKNYRLSDVTLERGYDNSVRLRLIHFDDVNVPMNLPNTTKNVNVFLRNSQLRVRLYNGKIGPPVVFLNIRQGLGAPGSKFSKAPLVEVPKARVECHYLKCHFLDFGERFYRILMEAPVFSRHITDDLSFIIIPTATSTNLSRKYGISVLSNSDQSYSSYKEYVVETFCTNKTPDYLYAITDYKLFRKDRIAFRKAKNKATNLLRKTKQTYFKNKVAENRNDPRKLWRLIRELDGVNVKENFTWRLNDGDKLVSDKYQIVEMFNSYFIELPKSIFTELINITGDYISPEKRVHSQLEIPHITPEQVNDFLDQIPVNKATGPDGVGIRLLKLAAPVISESLSRIINSCIITGKFPTKWKEAIVTPIYKDQIKHSVADIYADDTTLSYAHDYSSAPQSITVELQKDITNLADWSRVNHMVLNEEKTKTLLIAGKRLKKKMDTLDIDLMLNGKKLQQVTSFKLLGVTLDDELSFDIH